MAELNRAALEAWLATALGASRVAITGLVPLSGGAIQENWGLTVQISDGPNVGARDLVLRLDAASQLPFSHGRVTEFALLGVARTAGVPVPEPLALCSDPGVLGRPFFVMTRVPGTADARSLTGRAPIAGLAADLGQALARLHAVAPPEPGLALAPPPQDAARARVAEMRALLDRLGRPHPALEWGLAWLDARAPAPVPPRLAHRDFRTGNFLVQDDRLAAVLDWEFAGWSDPAEDLGWLTAPCWRFRRPDLDAGGIGMLADLLAGYAAAGGTPPSDARLRWWQVMATARWAAIALAQAERHRSGAERSLELALTGHLVPELELELLTMTGVG